MAKIAFDTWQYALSLQHIGHPLQIPSHPWPFLVRKILNTGYFDVVSPWPYVSHCDPAIMANTLQILKKYSFISLTVFFSPEDTLYLENWSNFSINLDILKPHFVLPRGKNPPNWSKKTRANINRARRHWQVQEISLKTFGSTIGQWHEKIALKHQFSLMSHVYPNHFNCLSNVPNITALGAFDKDGLGAALVVDKEADSIHFHTIVGHERSKKYGGSYALFDQAIALWGGTHTLYMGGQPGQNGEGVARFKKRFTTDEIPVWIGKVILNQDVYQLLTRKCKGNPDFFPAYRYPC